MTGSRNDYLNRPSFCFALDVFDDAGAENPEVFDDCLHIRHQRRLCHGGLGV